MLSLMFIVGTTWLIIMDIRRYYIRAYYTSYRISKNKYFIINYYNTMNNIVLK